ncbi:hypothetical protein HQ585_11680 [candidate division KSB1 bacterium]|nr:hypothetical protein [candidate division KSB1 bacterium]
MDKSKFNDKREWRKFGVGVTIILSGIATIQLIKSNPLYVYFYAGGGFFLLCGLLIPILLKPVFILFSYLGVVMGWFMTRVILSVLFYAIITPIGLISRLFGQHHLILRPDSNMDTYWMAAEKQKDRSKEFERQF